MRNDPRLRFCARLVVGLLAALVLRAAHVQLFQHERWEREGNRMRREVENIPARRGEIRSSDGQILARTVINWSLGVDPGMVEDEGALAVALDSLGLIRPAELRRKLDVPSDVRFVWLRREVLREAPLLQLKKRFPCISLQREAKRLYPLGPAGGSVVGLVNRDEAPLGGLEETYDEFLRGQPGRVLRVKDAVDSTFQGFLENVLQDSLPGADVEVTLHGRLQEIAAARLAAGVKREGAAGGFCIVTRPATGEILAMAAVPGFDPIDSETWRPEHIKVRPVTDVFEPGSSYKIVAFAACMEAGLFHQDEIIDCMNGSRPVPGSKPITDHHRYGALPAWEVLAKSSNIGSGILAERAGAERFYRMEKAFGFGLPTGICLSGEGRGRIPEPSSPHWTRSRSLITMAFGQEISCSALQMAMAYGAVANGGKLMRPLLVRSVRGPDGEVLEQTDPEVVRTVLRPSVAAELRQILRRVVAEGTGEKAEIAGFEPAGKTSTAQKYIPEEKAYSTRRYIGSFVGFAPWDDPQILCLVLLDEPTSSIYGGSVAAPIFREIVSDAIPFLAGGRDELASSPPTIWKRPEPDPRRSIPSVTGLSATLGRRLVREADFLPRLIGEGDRVLRTVPAAGEQALPGTVVTLELCWEHDPEDTLAGGTPLAGAGPGSGGVEMSPGTDAEGVAGEAPSDPRARPLTPAESNEPPPAAGSGPPMPDLRGLCLRDALLRARSAGVRVRVEGSGWVILQSPEPGMPLPEGVACWITLGPDSSRAYKEFLQGDQPPSRNIARGDLAGAPAR